MSKLHAMYQSSSNMKPEEAVFCSSNINTTLKSNLDFRTRNLPANEE